MVGEYCTPDDVKMASQVNFADLGFETDDPFELYLSNTVIPRAKAAIDSFCTRDFASHSAQTVYFDGTGKETASPPYTPIISITSLSRNTDYYGKGTWTEEIVTNYVFTDEFIALKSGFTAGRQNYKLVYAYGYATVPIDITDICAQAAANILICVVLRKGEKIIRKSVV